MEGKKHFPDGWRYLVESVGLVISIRHLVASSFNAFPYSSHDDRYAP